MAPEAIESITEQRRVFALFVALSCAMAIGAAVTGVNDNLPGILLCWGAVASAVLAFAHRWRRTRPYFLLLCASVATFIIGVVLHNLCWGIGHAYPDLPQWIRGVLEAIHVSAFLVAVIGCPPAIAVGLVGWLACAAGDVWQRLMRPRMG